MARSLAKLCIGTSSVKMVDIWNEKQENLRFQLINYQLMIVGKSALAVSSIL